MDALGLDRDLEARKHLWRGLARLRPRRRVAFVGEMCRRVSGGGVETRVTSSTGTVGECVGDVVMLAVNHGLDLSHACEALERTLREGG
jgi:hypothetical protein